MKLLSKLVAPTIILYLASSPCLAKTDTTINLDMLVGYAAAASNRAEQIKAGLINNQSQGLRALSPMDGKVTGKYSVLDNRFESAGASSFSAERTRIQSIQAGYEKMFRSGTILGASVKQNRSLIDIPATGAPGSSAQSLDQSETQGSIFVRQSLWKNGFGKAIKSGIAAAEKSAEAQIKTAKSQLETYIGQLIQQYYLAWNLQQTHKSTNKRLAIQNRLIKVTKLKANRGTAEKPDVLQVEAAKLQSQNQLAELKNQLQEIWSTLVISLGLPESYRKIDPTTIQLVLADRSKEANAWCKQSSKFLTKDIEAIDLRMQAQEQRISQLESSTKPDLYLEARYGTNGVDEKGATAFSEAGKNKHPQISIGIGIEWPLSQNISKADYLDTIAAKQQLQVSREGIVTDLEINKANLCRELNRLSEKESYLTRIRQQQAERVRLEENRFKLGQVDLNLVIGASNDLTTAELDLTKITSSRHLAAWEIMKISGGLESYIETSVKTIAGATK